MLSRTSTLLHQLKNLETRSGNNPRSLNSLAAAVAIQRMVERILDGWMEIGDTRGFNWFEHRSGGTMARDVSERKDPFDAIVVELMKDGQFRQQIEEIINHSPESDSPIFGNLAREYLNNPNIGEDTRRFLEELFERPTRDSSDKGR